MRILGISHINSGCGFHRVVMPLGYMDDIVGTITNLPTEEVMNEGWDILLFNRISGFDEDFDYIREKMGCKIVVDMDDAWGLPTNHLNYYDYLHLSPRIENNLRNADLVTCTNENLAKKIRPLNSNVVIVPNAILFGQHQFIPDKVESDKIRIFWCGGITHEGDLEILKNPIRRLTAHKDKIEMVLGGYNDENELSKFIWDKMFSYFTSSGQLPHQIIKGTTPDKYMSMYSHADIMLVPLLQSDWSGCKSNLKLLEASVKKVPVICSAVEPYTLDKSAPVLWVENQSDWYKHLRFLINNKNAREDYGEKLNEWAKKSYDLIEVNKIRRSAFANLIKS
jgi:glycosyltransferase involved in cell wall biosynthesis